MAEGGEGKEPERVKLGKLGACYIPHQVEPPAGTKQQQCSYPPPPLTMA